MNRFAAEVLMDKISQQHHFQTPLLTAQSYACFLGMTVLVPGKCALDTALVTMPHQMWGSSVPRAHQYTVKLHFPTGLEGSEKGLGTFTKNGTNNDYS